MTAELDFITIAEAARLIAARKLSPVELTKAKLARIAAFDSQLNAFITLTADLALQQAQAAEAEIGAGRYRGTMHGIPFGLKDLTPLPASSRRDIQKCASTMFRAKTRR